jgi:hypothetical protein
VSTSGNIKKVKAMADNDEAQVYILRNYDMKLTASSFRCVMVTGSHYNGTTIVEGSEAWNSDITQGTVKTYQSGSSEFTAAGGKVYNFDSSGIGTDNSYRLMLIEGSSKDASEKALEDIAKYLKDINETLAEYVSSVDRNIKEAKRIAEDAKSAVSSMESTIEDLDERVTALEDKEDE